MDDAVLKIKNIVDESLGHRASPIFMNRVADALDGCANDKESLCLACAKVKKMVYLFIGIDDAERIAEQFKQVINENT